MGIRRYRINLVVKGPIHIGNGRMLGKKDYFLQRGKIVVLDPAKFVAQLDQEQVVDYCAFLESNSRTGLEDFLRDHGLHDKAEQAQAYRIDASLSRRRNGGWQYLEANEFVKDAYGCPYIPGSSFKGMLRTVLLATLIENDRAAFMQEYPQSVGWRKNKDADNGIEKRALWKECLDADNPDVVNDIMRYVSVSDSDPLSTDDLVFAKKYDKFSKEDKAEHKRRMGNQSICDIADGNELNIYRECLRPGTVATLHLNIDERVDEHLPFLLDEMHLKDIICRFEMRYRTCFLDAFESEEDAGGGESSTGRADDGICLYVAKSGPLAGMRCRNHAVAGTRYCNKHQDEANAKPPTGVSADSELVCYLGGGIDFDSKTVLNALFSNEAERLHEVSHILYEQFPTRIDDKFAGRKYRTLWNNVEENGFRPCSMKAKLKQDNSVVKAKDDHRHWMDEDLGVSPHTMKLGKVGDELLPMGKCAMSIEAET